MAARVLSFNNGKGEDDDHAFYDHIQELRAELRGCTMTRHERTAVKAELARISHGK
jgi:hypothetical protein